MFMLPSVWEMRALWSSVAFFYSSFSPSWCFAPRRVLWTGAHNSLYDPHCAHWSVSCVRACQFADVDDFHVHLDDVFPCTFGLRSCLSTWLVSGFLLAMHIVNDI
eukprot:TRINITY_DN10031_c0_g1_i2.p1 TRINITY_DN10031_c0_g1~~TRINITY_DN10031_c0_g1_i2.p1  ORF type:complete len:105 (-),score=2.10 TRINITY_DN10031_c0_g1_i2:7-321(-)